MGINQASAIQSNSTPLVLRATASAYGVFGVIFGFLTLMSARAAISDKSVAPAFVAPAVAWILSYLWLYRFRIVLATDSLSYTTLFAGTRTYLLANIHQISFESGIHHYSDRFKPFIRLVIKLNNEVGSKPLYINLKVFSRQGVRQLFDTLRSKFEALGRPEVVKNL